MTTKSGFHWTASLTTVLMLVLCLSIGPEAKQVAAEPSPNGLQGSYFANKDLTNLKVSRRDPAVKFYWNTSAPAPSIRSKTFSARWTGQVEAPRDGRYTFTVRSTGGAKLWVNGRLVANRWRAKGAGEDSGNIVLEGGKLYKLRMEYVKNGTRSGARLLWEGPGTPRTVIPAAKLYLPGKTLPEAPPVEEPPVEEPPVEEPPVEEPPVEEPPVEEPPVGLPAGAELWSDPETWGGSVPKAGQAVTVPSGKTVVLDVNTPSLKSLRVDGNLVFAERDLDLTAGWVMVHGKLQIGTEASPYTHDADITLTASDKSEDVMGMGTKMLSVMGGTLELHGEERRGWTKLAQTANAGTSRIVLTDTTGWRAGDRIVVASTDYDFEQAEEATIKSISGRTVTLDRNLEYQHWGTVQTYDGVDIDERAEVGLLSRNITIQGNDASESDGFGGQMMIMNGEARIEGVELTRMGQKGLLRRYPLHFHMLGDAPESYIRDSSIHNAYNRCVTVHGTNEATLSGNVCHDTIGHGFFLEDGAEHDNTFENNLGMTIRAPKPGEAVAEHDRQLGGPSAYWITNPDNTFRNNVAAGSAGYGFWYAMPVRPLGLSKNSAERPIRTTVKEFSGNTAHSNGIEGLRVHDSPTESGSLEYSFYSPRVDPANDSSERATAVYQDFTAYKNRYHGVWLSGEYQTLSGAKLADNLRGATFASQEVVIQDSFIVGETANKGTPAPGAPKGVDGRSLPQPWAPKTPVVGYEFYDGNVGAERVKFVNFNSNSLRSSGALGYTHGSAFPVDPRNYAEGLSFTNSNRVYFTDLVEDKDGDASKVFLDRDGSVSGKSGSFVVADSPFLTNSNCEKKDGWNAFVCDNDYVSLAVESMSGGPLNQVNLTRADGVSERYTGCCSGSSSVNANVISGGDYGVTFDGAIPQKTRYIMKPSQKGWAELRIKAPRDARVTNYSTVLKPVESLNALRGSTRTAYFYNADTGTVHIKMVSNGYWEVAGIEIP